MFGGSIITLDSASTSTSDQFFSVAGGASLFKPISNETALLASVSISTRLHDKATQFDQNVFGGSIGLRWASRDNALNLALQLQSFELDGSRFRDSTGGVLQYQRTISPRTAASAYLQYARLSYPSQSIRDADRTIVGGSVEHHYDFKYQPTVWAGIYGGNESERASGVPHLGHKPIGVRTGVMLKLDTSLTFNASVGYEQRHYGGPDPLFLVSRRDHQTDFSVGAAWESAPKWSLQPKMSWSKNDSNIALNSYTRNVLLVSVRREF